MTQPQTPQGLLQSAPVRISNERTTNDLGPYGQAESPRWRPRSPTAELRQWFRSHQLPLPRDRLQALRILREHPSWLTPTETKSEAEVKELYRILPLSLTEMEQRVSLQARQRNLPRVRTTSGIRRTG